MSRTNSISGRKGFTLIEVVVVAVIVGILAAVAIPVYLGYVNNSAQNAANNEAVNFSTAVGTAINNGFTGTVTGAAATIAGGTTLIWPKTGFPTTLTDDVKYKVASSVTITSVTPTTLLTSPGSATITVKGQTATASW